MKPQYVVRDETSYWGDRVRAMIGPDGKIKTSYLFDAESGTYLCEMTPSYDLRHIDTWLETDLDLSEEDREWLYDALLEGHEDIYMHVSDMRRLNPKDVSFDPEDTFEEIHEHCVANCGSFS